MHNPSIVDAGPQPMPDDASLSADGRSLLSWTIVALFLLNCLNYIDRLLFSVAQEMIKVDLHLSDFQLGLIGGPAFAILYTVFSFPIARAADRGRRVGIIAISLTLWSAMTAFCGIAANFVQMLVGRAAVSIGEAGCTPASHSLISDAFPAQRRTTAIAIFAVAGPFGAIVAAVGGGALIAAYGWRTAFLICGMAGIVMALLFRATVPEPPRSQPRSHHSASFIDTLRQLLARRSFALVAVAGGVAGIGSYANQQYMVSFLMRGHGLSLANASALMGLVIGGVGIVFTLLGGPMMDLGARRYPRIKAWLPSFGLLWCGALYAAAFQIPTVGLAVALMVLGSMGQHFYMPAMYAHGQDVAPPHMRAMASAVIIATSSILGYGLGPPLIGLASDILGESARVSAGLSLAECAKRAVAACEAASAQGLRLSLSLGSCFFILAAVLFALASRWVVADVHEHDRH
ncbi:spinster family MFS transporter [Sphingobium sp. CCH11-B1]|uniref:spinster family MFS transporter n=1 Tax=Sphingobium sp. CCH11-B1 TaxID=1768781 RepID=UPI000AD19569|nr:MFS transporter [Sphingobium sp. CCH11-B1]